MPFPAFPVSVSCQNCGNTFTVKVHHIVDVGEEPELKERFLRGQLNSATCPECGQGAMLNASLVYHDPEKELLITYVPAELGMPADEQEEFVGSLVNAVMNNVPAEERKGYFFQPKTALTMDSLYNMVLEAEGISTEMLEEQRALMGLIEELLSAREEDEERFHQIVNEHRDELDYSFFLTLSELIEVSREGEEERGEQLAQLRQALLEEAGPDIGAAASALTGEAVSYEDLIAMLREIEDEDAWSRSVALNRQRLDYGFFQALTAQIEATEDQEEAEILQNLRERLLEEIEEQEQMLQEAQDEANLLIMELLQAEDRQAAIREHIEEIDELVLIVLSRLQSAAEKRGNESRAQDLQSLTESILEIMQENLPPDLRLISALLRAEYPEESNELLEEQRDLLNNEFLELYDVYVENLDRPDEDQISAKMKKIREQIEAKMQIQRG